MTAVISADGIGYGIGSGGTVTQLTSKSTTVTFNKPCGQITTAADALGAGSSAVFTINNSVIAAFDVVIANSLNVNYSVRISDVVTGSFKLTIKNEFAGSLSQAVTISLAIIKGVTS